MPIMRGGSLGACAGACAPAGTAPDIFGAALPYMMGLARALISGVAFVAVGLAAIVVGAFMLRGNMHMWDRRDGADSEK